MERLHDFDVPSRRLRVMRISIALLVEMWKGDGPRIFIPAGMPEDAKVVGVKAESLLDEVHIRLESESFEEVPYGYEIPRLDVTFTAVNLSRYATAPRP